MPTAKLYDPLLRLAVCEKVESQASAVYKLVREHLGRAPEASDAAALVARLGYPARFSDCLQHLQRATSPCELLIDAWRRAADWFACRRCGGRAAGDAAAGLQATLWQGCRLRCGKAVGGARAELQAALRQGCRRRWAAGDAAAGL